MQRALILKIYIYQEDNFIKQFNSNENKSKKLNISKERTDSLINLVTLPIQDNNDSYEEFSNSHYYNKSFDRFVEKNTRGIPVYSINESKIQNFSKSENSNRLGNLSTKRIFASNTKTEDSSKRYKIELIKEWFFENYEEARVFSKTRPLDTFEIIYKKYCLTYSPRIIDIAVNEIINQTGINNWVKKEI